MQFLLSTDAKEWIRDKSIRAVHVRLTENLGRFGFFLSTNDGTDCGATFWSFIKNICMDTLRSFNMNKLLSYSLLWIFFEYIPCLKRPKPTPNRGSLTQKIEARNTSSFENGDDLK